MDKTLVCGPQCVTHLYSCGQTFLNVNSGGTFSVSVLLFPLNQSLVWMWVWSVVSVFVCVQSQNCPLWWHICVSCSPFRGGRGSFVCCFFFFFFCKKELKYAIFLLYSPLTRTKPHFFRKVYRQKRNSVPFCVHTLSSFQRGPGFSFWSMSAPTEPQSSFLAAFMWVLETETPSKR